MGDADTSLGKLTEASLKRKERLRRLREQATQGAGDNKAGDDVKTLGDDKLPKPIFRSYKPQNEHTDAEILPQEPSGEIEKEVQSQLELLKQPLTIDEIDIANLAPRKPDWDLKRDVSKKLERLDRRTQKAIAELIRERLNQTGDLLQAVNVGTARIGKTDENVGD